MSDALQFARGPLFLACFLFMVLALVRLVALQTRQVIQVLKRTPARDVPWRKVVKSSAEWVIPVRHILREVPILSIASIAFHVGLILTPIFLADHVFLWSRGIGVSWPALSAGAADFLTLMTLGAAAILLSVRVLRPAARKLSRAWDYLLLILVTLPFVSGYLASHPAGAPMRYETLMFVHVMSANLLFILVPTTKLAHMVLFPFARISGDLFWRLVPGAGDMVAEELRGTREGAEA